MLGSLMVWRALAQDKRAVRTLGIAFLLILLATIIWNLLP